MKTLHFLLPTLLLVGAPVWAVEPVVVGPRSFKRDTPGVYKVPAGKGKLSLEEIDGVVVLRRPGELIVVGPPGEKAGIRNVVGDEEAVGAKIF